MTRYIAMAKLFCAFLFVLGCVGVVGYQFMWKIPAKRCEDAGRWWLDSERVCGIPIQISQITGRPLAPMKRPDLAPAAPAVAATKAN